MPEIQLPIGINTEAWDEWCEFRRIEKKKKVGPIAAKKQFKMLLKYSEEDQQVIIDNSISNGYQGLFDLKGGSNENNKPGTPQGQNKRDTARQQRQSDLERLRQSAQQPHNQNGGGVELVQQDIRPLLGRPMGPNGSR